MSEKRRDKKGRLLRAGEYQRKDGKYEYKYVDIDGNRKSVYSWQLVSTDRVPSGKKSDGALRDLELLILKDIQDGIHSKKKLTFAECYTQYISTKRRLKITTLSHYNAVYDRYVQPEFGNRIVDSITKSKIKRYYEGILYDKGLSMQSLKGIHGIMNATLQFAAKEKYMRENPASEAFGEVKNEHVTEKETIPRISLTEEQQNRFMCFLSTYRNQQLNDMVTVLLGTGCRLGELLGLTWSDCDFNNRIIKINHNLAYIKDDTGKRNFHITTTKTSAGTREIPMLDMVREALLRTKRRSDANESREEKVSVGGYTDFVFLNRRGNLYIEDRVYVLFEYAINSYNKQEEEAAKAEGRDPDPLPMFSAHNLRHTFCTRFCENETNVKVIQSIMGHSNINVTMDIYNHATRAKKEASMRNLNSVLNNRNFTTNFTTNY